MKPDSKPQPPRADTPRPATVLSAMRQAQAMDAKRQADRKSVRSALWIGCLAVLGVFIYLANLPPASTPASAPTVMAKPAAPVAAPKPPAAKPEAPAAKPAEPAAEPVAPPSAEPEPAEVATVPPTEAERIAAEKPLTLVGLESHRDAALQRDADLLKRTIDGKAWDAYRNLLGRSVVAASAGLEAGRGVNRFDPIWNEPALYQAMLRWKTIGSFSEAEISSLITDSYSGAMFMWLLHDNKAMEELLLTIKPEDDGGKVLKFLMDAWPVNKDKFAEYFALALACAVVFDQPMGIPNPIGEKPEYGKPLMVEPLTRYLWYVKKNEGGELAARVNHAAARDLIWAVCAPVTTAELEWSLKKMHLRRKRWGEAYGMVKYLMERAVNGLNPYKEYSFAEILKEGGICADQSYFCVNTARAQGIPAMVIVGETDAGGHAWAGIQIDDDEWTTGVGRIGGASKGETSNPQTGRGVSEQEIQLWNDRFHQSPVVTLNVWRHLWIADLFAAMSKPDDSAAAVHLANSLGHTFVETWQALYKLLERQTVLAGDPAVPKNLTDWKDFAKDMRREYKENPRMAGLAATAEMEYIFPYGETGDAKRTLLRERRRIERESGEQKDLIASSLQREAEVILKAGGPNAKRDISRLYDRALRDYGGSITGFKMMANDYFGYLKDDKELAHKAARDIELAFKRVVETGTTSFFRATTEAEISKMICSYYREAGDPERATLLEKRYEVLLRRAKRGAL